MYRAAVVGLLVVLAGCSIGPSGQPTIEETVTPAPQPVVEPADGPAASGPWLLDGERIAPVALASSHGEHLEDQARVVTVRSVAETYGYHAPNVEIVENGTTWFSGDGVVQHSETRHRIPRDDRQRDWWENTTSYQVKGDRFVRRHRNGTTTTTVHRAVREPHVDSARIVSWALNVENASVERVERDGTTYVRIHSEESADPTLDWATDYEVTALVTESGFVREVAVNYTFEQFGKYRQVRYRMTVERIDPSEIPAWQRVADVDAPTTPRPT